MFNFLEKLGKDSNPVLLIPKLRDGTDDATKRDTEMCLFFLFNLKKIRKRSYSSSPEASKPSRKLEVFLWIIFKKNQIKVKNLFSVSYKVKNCSNTSSNS